MLVGWEDYRELALEASRRSRLGLRVFMLSTSGSLSLSSTRSRCCPGCGTLLTFEHFISCATLGDDLRALFADYGRSKEWKLFIDVLLGRFETFIHFIRGGQCDDEETALFSMLHKEAVV
jgi:hypothetical protein